jgi:hypothetical protein
VKQTESYHQRALIAWARLTRLPQSPDVEVGATVGDWLFAVPNGGARRSVTAAILKAEGVKPGVHDLFLPLMRRGYAGLSIELKAPGGRATPAQAEWQRKMRRAGYQAEICVGWPAAANTIAHYIGIPPVSPTAVGKSLCSAS